MIRTMLAAPLVIRAIARPTQKRYQPLESAILNRREAAERDAAAQREQHVHLADTADVKKTEGAEEDEGA